MPWKEGEAQRKKLPNCHKYATYGSRSHGVMQEKITEQFHKMTTIFTQSDIFLHPGQF